ncbi:unnamed protein product [Vitrella brassicaformis CCMP3155]|uniref:Uncharacterized protein n=1 Tax=Vitrella brassicaformis (strain CCMP3155) TaxID=1169540 RepID=A0A0G4G8E1_VITBC|nr:unnamed protein product [Vitrella brassicaformis CCMP3155]|eukprot:CEM25064.1 unnamed protein product [Vitrella brassicaformis CCMP3155]
MRWLGEIIAAFPPTQQYLHDNFPRTTATGSPPQTRAGGTLLATTAIITDRRQAAATDHSFPSLNIQEYGETSEIGLDVDDSLPVFGIEPPEQARRPLVKGHARAHTDHAHTHIAHTKGRPHTIAPASARQQTDPSQQKGPFATRSGKGAPAAAAAAAAASGAAVSPVIGPLMEFPGRKTSRRPSFGVAVMPDAIPPSMLKRHIGSGVDSHACHRAFHCQNYFLKIDARDGVERIRATIQGLQLG